MTRPVLRDRVKQLSTSTGLGNFILSDSVNNYSTFLSAYGTSSRTFYTIVNADANPSEWETGYGYITSTSVISLVREVVYRSTNNDAPVNFSPGVKYVFSGLPADKTVTYDYDVSTVTITGSLVVSGSMIVTGSITGSVVSSSFSSTASTARSSSYALTASWAPTPTNVVSSSYALTASWSPIPTVLSGSVTGSLTGSVRFSNYEERVISSSLSANTLSLDLSLGTVYDVIVSTSMYVNLTGFPSNSFAKSTTLICRYDGPRTVTWHPSILWPGNTAPSISSVSGAIDILSFITIASGSRTFGVLSFKGQ